MEFFASANRVVVEAKVEEEIADPCHRQAWLVWSLEGVLAL